MDMDKAKDAAGEVAEKADDAAGSADTATDKIPGEADDEAVDKGKASSTRARTRSAGTRPTTSWGT